MREDSQLEDPKERQIDLLKALSSGGTPFGVLPLFSLDEEDRRRKHALDFEKES